MMTIGILVFLGSWFVPAIIAAIALRRIADAAQDAARTYRNSKGARWDE